MMLIVGEKINTTKKSINAAVEARNVEAIRDAAIAQVEAGADIIDVNSGTRIKTEVADMEWLVNVVQEAVECQLCIDSPDPAAIEMGLKLVKQKPHRAPCHQHKAPYFDEVPRSHRNNYSTQPHPPVIS